MTRVWRLITITVFNWIRDKVIGLGNREQGTGNSNLPNRSNNCYQLFFSGAGIGIWVSLLVVFLRLWGGLQLLELLHYDLMFSLRSQLTSIERSDRIVIVGYTESDLAALNEPILSDENLYLLLSKILKQNPKLVGLDFFRDTLNENSNQLQKLFQKESRLYVAARFLGNKQEKILPPSTVPLERVGDVSVPLDFDGVLRRNFLSVCQLRDPNLDRCQRYIPSLSLRLALADLKTEGIDLERNEKGWFQLGNGIFPQVIPHTGGYINVPSGGGYQILVNWRSPFQSFTTVTVSEVIEGNVSPDFFQDRIVLVGSLAPSQQDLFTTPYSAFFGFDRIFGVESIALLTEQILWAAHSDKSNLFFISDGIEYGLIFIFAELVLGVLISAYTRISNSLVKLFIIILLAFSSFAFLISFIGFLNGYWLPFIPYALVIAIALTVQSFILSDRQRQNYLRQLETELNLAQRQLEELYEREIVKEKNDSLSFLGAKLAHDLRNFLGVLEGDLHNSFQLTEELASFYEDDEEWSQLQQRLQKMKDNLKRTQNFVNAVLSHVSYVESDEVVMSSIHPFLEQVLSRFFEQLGEESATISLFRDYDCSLDQLEIPLLEVTLEQALFNILDNSWDALSARSQWSDSFPFIKLVTRNQEDFIIIEIIDNGIGIEPEMRSQVFERLFTSKPKGKGTGLGLYIVYESIVKLHRGDVSIDEDSDGNTCVQISLPKQFRQRY